MYLEFNTPIKSRATKKEKDVEAIAAVINIPEMNILAYASYKHCAFINNKSAKVSKVRTPDKSFIVYWDIDNGEIKPHTSGFSSLINKYYFNRGYGDAFEYTLLAQKCVDIAPDRRELPRAEARGFLRDS